MALVEDYNKVIAESYYRAIAKYKQAEEAFLKACAILEEQKDIRLRLRGDTIKNRKVADEAREKLEEARLECEKSIG